MAVPTALDEVLIAEILNVVRTKFNLDEASNIEVNSVEVDQDEHKIRIDILITTTESPKLLAKSYFGLTGKVREVLGSDWDGFFPVITPQFNSGLHA